MTSSPTKQIAKSAGIHILSGHIQHYAWGGTRFIPNLLNIANEAAKPFAEYWLGTHAGGPTQVLSDGKQIPLATAINAQELPPLNFLLKVLDVADMLSLQVHPNKEQALMGFECEQQQGIELSAKHRCYKDKNHKPELMVALSKFWLLHGFASDDEIEKRLSTLNCLQPLLSLFQSSGLESTLRMVLDNKQDCTAKLENTLIKDLGSKSFPNKSSIFYWLKLWATKHPDVSQGLLTMLLLNLVELDKGDGIYQPAGLIHSYLEGQAVEIMANSDNVLRAGLTPKFVNIPELLNICTIAPTQPEKYRIPFSLNGNEFSYTTPFGEFELSQIQLNDISLTQAESTNSEIYLCLSGSLLARDLSNSRVPSTQTTINSGDAFFVTPNSKIKLTPKSTDTIIFKAKNQ